MNLFPTETLIKMLLGVLVSVIISASIYAGYSHIKHIGYLEAEAKYTIIIKKYEDDVNKKIDTVVTMSSDLARISQANNEQLATDVASILAKVKGKQLVVVKNGECTPSSTFSNSITEINKRINQSMKDGQK